MSLNKETKKRPVGRPRTSPVYKPDYWGRPLRKGDFVNYPIPGNFKGKGKLVFGEIVGKRQGFLEIECLEDRYYGDIHCKHGHQVVRIPGDVKAYIKTREEVKLEETKDGEAEERLQEGEGTSD